MTKEEVKMSHDKRKSYDPWTVMHSKLGMLIPKEAKKSPSQWIAEHIYKDGTIRINRILCSKREEE